MEKETPSQKENSLNSLLCNIVVPVVCLMYLPKLLTNHTDFGEDLSQKIGLVVALIFPISYFLYHFIKTKKTSFISIVGFIGILVTGVIGLLKLPAEYVAYERATVPLLFAIAILATNLSKTPLIKKFFYNPMLFNTEKIDKLLEERGTEKDFNKTLKNTSYMLAASFLFSSICNFFVTRHYMTDDNFTESLGRVKIMSLVITIVPLLAIMVGAILYFQKRLKEHTGVENTEDLYSEELKEKEK